jgi:hypothetical protein
MLRRVRGMVVGKATLPSLRDVFKSERRALAAAGSGSAADVEAVDSRLVLVLYNLRLFDIIFFLIGTTL